MNLKNKQYLCILTIISWIILILFIYGCFSKVNKHKSFINMLLEYYPNQEIKIIESDPNKLIIQIIKGNK